MEQKKERRKLGLAILISLFSASSWSAYSLAAFGSALTPALPLEDKPVELTIVDLSATPASAGAEESAVHGDRAVQGVGGKTERADLRVEREFDGGEPATCDREAAAADRRTAKSVLP